MGIHFIIFWRQKGALLTMREPYLPMRWLYFHVSGHKVDILIFRDTKWVVFTVLGQKGHLIIKDKPLYAP